MSLTWLETPKNQQNEEQDNPIDRTQLWSIFNKWMSDGSLVSEVPQIIIDKKLVGPQYLLYYFQSSPFLVDISDMFNTYSIFKMDTKDCLKLIKQYVVKRNFKPGYIKLEKKEKDTPLYKELKNRFIYLKAFDVFMLCQIVDESENRDLIYESLGLIKSKKKKLTKKELSNISSPVKESKKETWTLEKLLKCFEIKELQTPCQTIE